MAGTIGSLDERGKDKERRNGQPVSIRKSATALTLILLALCGLSPTLAAAGAGRAVKKKHHTPPPPEVALSPSLTSAPGAQIGMPPVGLSIEYPVMAADLGQGECPPPALAAELQRLGLAAAAAGGTEPGLHGSRRPATGPPQSWEDLTAYPLASEFWSRLHCLLGTSRDPLTAGLNVRVGRLSWAEQMVAGATSAATNGTRLLAGQRAGPLLPARLLRPGQAPAGRRSGSQVGRYLQAAGAITPRGRARRRWSARNCPDRHAGGPRCRG